MARREEKVNCSYCCCPEINDIWPFSLKVIYFKNAGKEIKQVEC